MSRLVCCKTGRCCVAAVVNGGRRCKVQTCAKLKTRNFAWSWSKNVVRSRSFVGDGVAWQKFKSSPTQGFIARNCALKIPNALDRKFHKQCGKSRPSQR